MCIPVGGALGLPSLVNRILRYLQQEHEGTPKITQRDPAIPTLLSVEPGYK